MQISVHFGNQAPNRITQQGSTENPEDTAEYIVSNECPVIHFRRAGHGRNKSSDDWNKARQNDRLCSIFFIENVCPFYLFGKSDITGAQGSACLSTDHISRLIAKNCRKHRKNEQVDNIELTGRGEDARSDQQRVAGEKEAEEQTGFDKDDCGDSRNGSPCDDPFNIE